MVEEQLVEEARMISLSQMEKDLKLIEEYSMKLDEMSNVVSQINLDLKRLSKMYKGKLVEGFIDEDTNEIAKSIADASTVLEKGVLKGLIVANNNLSPAKTDMGDFIIEGSEDDY